MTQPIVCNGRAVDAENRPVGQPCARTAPQHRIPGVTDYLEELRAAGWRVGPIRADGGRDAMCPPCARPDPELTRTLRELRRG